MTPLTTPTPAPKSNYYFAKEQEDAVVDYISTSDVKVRRLLYETTIQPALANVVDKIIYTYKFNALPNHTQLAEECKVWLPTVIDKFKPKKGYKAFSYFSVITKNWFIQKAKRNTLLMQNEVSYDDKINEIDAAHSLNNEYDDKREQIEFLQALLVDMDRWSCELSEQDKRVLESIKVLFNNIEDVEIFNKKAIYIYMREITNLNSKQITSSIIRIKNKYSNFKKGYDNREE